MFPIAREGLVSSPHKNYPYTWFKGYLKVTFKSWTLKRWQFSSSSTEFARFLFMNNAKANALNILRGVLLTLFRQFPTAKVDGILAGINSESLESILHWFGYFAVPKDSTSNKMNVIFAKIFMISDVNWLKELIQFLLVSTFGRNTSLQIPCWNYFSFLSNIFPFVPGSNCWICVVSFWKLGSIYI